MKKPNLFEIGTKELIQDAFLSWLMAWADPQYAEMHQQGKDFITWLLKKAQPTIPTLTEFRTVSVQRQWYSADIKVEVNDEHFIIIEDKTTSGVHNNQLERYKEKAEEAIKEKLKTLSCIYLKTGDESIGKHPAIKEQGYTVITREDLLEFFEGRTVENDIYTDFVDRLKQIDCRSKSYLKDPIKDWKGDSWTGFYTALEKTGAFTEDYIGWGYVANPSGGFWGCYWGWYGVQGTAEAYLQIEQGQLVFKVGEEDPTKQKDIRETLYDQLMELARKKGDTTITKPNRVRKGRTMTFAVVSRQDWLGGDDEIVDIPAVVKRLQAYEDYLKQLE